MEDNLKELKQEYKEKKKEVNSSSEYHQLRKDYKETKNTLKEVNKIIKENDLLEPVDGFMNKFNFQSFEEFKENNNSETINKTYDEQNGNILEQQKHSSEDIAKLINDIDKKIEKLNKKEKNTLNTTINLIVSDMIPDTVYDIISQLSSIEFSLGEIEFFSKEEIDNAQKGFRFNPATNEIINAWIGNNYIIIGYDCTQGYGPNPIIIKVDDVNYPIYWLLADGGDWNHPMKIADSLDAFVAAYKKLLEHKNHIENNCLSKEEKELLICEIGKTLNNLNIDWWKNLIMNNGYFNELSNDNDAMKPFDLNKLGYHDDISFDANDYGEEKIFVSNLQYNGVNITIIPNLEENIEESKKHLEIDYNVLVKESIENSVLKDLVPWLKEEEFSEKDDLKVLEGLKISHIQYKYGKNHKKYSPTDKDDYFGTFIFDFESSNNYTREMLYGVAMEICIVNNKIMVVDIYDI